MIKNPAIKALFLALALLPAFAQAQPAPAATQSPWLSNDDWVMEGNRVTGAFLDLSEESRKATVEIAHEFKNVQTEKMVRQQVALGTIVTGDGLIVTKASEVQGKNLLVTLFDGRSFPAKVINTDFDNDLAILRIEAQGLVAAQWADAAAASALGQWIAVPSTLAKRAGTETSFVPRVWVGVISAAQRKVPREGGVLGVNLDVDEKKSQEVGGVLITIVQTNSGAHEAGIIAGDVITHVEGRAVSTQPELREALSQFPPGQTIIVTIKRDGNPADFAVTLKARSEVFGMMEQRPQRGGAMMAIPLSKRRDGFDEIIQHHVAVNATALGGPLVNLDGKVIGVNIARASRNETYALPAALVQKIIARLSPEPSSSPAAAEPKPQ